MQESLKPVTHPCDDSPSRQTQRHQEEGHQHRPEAHDSNRTGIWTLSEPLTLDNRSRHTGSPTLQVIMKVPRTPQRGELHSLPLFIYLQPHPPSSIPPSRVLPTPSPPVSSDALSSYSIRWQLTNTHSGPLYLYPFTYYRVQPQVRGW